MYRVYVHTYYITYVGMPGYYDGVQITWIRIVPCTLYEYVHM